MVMIFGFSIVPHVTMARGTGESSVPAFQTVLLIIDTSFLSKDTAIVVLGVLCSNVYSITLPIIPHRRWVIPSVSFAGFAEDVVYHNAAMFYLS